MSTYLVAFIVCDFLYVENATKSGVKFRVWAKPNSFQKLDFALSHGLAIFNWLNDHFKPSYPLTKLDNIAIPEFFFGGMENWGAVTYREDILYESGVSTATLKNFIVTILGHEFAHMWFGNTVTNKWWSWLWLKEGVATFWEMRAVDKAYPTWRKIDLFVASTMQDVLQTDSLRSSRPLTNIVESPNEIRAHYGGVTYAKGACIVRMMEFIMGEDLFMDAMNLYLQRFQGKSAENQDMWDALNDEALNQNKTINMTDIMDPWVTQMNYPVIHVTRTGNGVIRVSQRRFLSTPGQNATNDVAPYSYMWEVPITFASNLQLNFEKQYSFEDIRWLKKTQREDDINDASIPDPADNDTWVIVNVKQYGFCRVNYDNDNWMAIINQLNTNHSIIHPINRAQIINDAWAMVKANMLDVSIALRTLDFIKDDDDYVPWKAFLKPVKPLGQKLMHSDLYGGFKNFMRTMVYMSYMKYGWNISYADLPIKTLATINFIQNACDFGIEDCEDTALRMYRQLMSNPSTNL